MQVKARVKEVALHRDSPLGDAVLECYASGSRNVFALGFVPVKSENTASLSSPSLSSPLSAACAVQPAEPCKGMGRWEGLHIHIAPESKGQMRRASWEEGQSEGSRHEGAGWKSEGGPAGGKGHAGISETGAPTLERRWCCWRGTCRHRRHVGTKAKTVK